MAAPAQLEVLLAPAGGGKTAAALAAYRAALNGGGGAIGPRRRALWLAPTQAAAADVRDALATGGGDAFLDPGVTTFAGLATQLAWDLGLRVRLISTFERRQVLRRVIAEAAANGSLEHYGRVADTLGLVNLVDEAISSFKRRDISVDLSQRASRAASPRRRELAELYARYERRLSAGRLLDAEGLILAARDGLRGAPEAVADVQLAVVDGFTDFTPAQLEILKIIAGRARRVLVTLVGEPGGPGPGRAARSDLFAKTQATCEALEQLGASDTSPAPSPQSPASPALAHLQRNLFRSYGDFEPLSHEERRSLAAIEVVAASSMQAEIEEIARRVKRLLVDGVPPGEIVVAFRSTREVADRVRGAFADFGIPAHFDVPRRLAATSLVRSLLAVLRLHAEDWTYRLLLHVVGDRSLSVFDRQAVVRQWPVDGADERMMEGRTAVDLCVRHAQLPVGRRALLDQVASWAADDAGLGAVESKSASRANDLLMGLSEELGKLPERADMESWIGAMEHLGAAIGLFQVAHDGAAGPLPSPPHEGEGAGGERAAAWAALVRGLRAIGRIERSAGACAADFSVGDNINFIGNVVTELPAPDFRDATGCVRVQSADAARFARPRHLFVGGLSEQAFSAGRRADSRAYGDDDEAEPLDDAAGDEMLLFYQLVSRATETLTLSYPALDAKAQSMPPSPFLAELQRCFAGEVRLTTQPLGYKSQLEDKPMSRSDLRRHAVTSSLDGKRELLAAVIRSPRFKPLGQSLLDGIAAVASRGDRRAFGPFEGVFASDSVRAILERKFGPEHLWSPSKLETYAACPFRFFGEHVLGLAAAPELALESDLARRGSVLHETLARLYVRLNAAAAEGEPAPTPEVVAQRFQETLDAIVGGQPRYGLDGVLREIERRQIAAWAQKIAEQHREYSGGWRSLDTPLIPTYFEARFGPKHRRSESTDDASLSTDTPFELAVGKERIRFTGQIDRIDVGRVGDATVFNVIDYKTGAGAKVNPKQIEAGTQMQLPLYAMAAAELLLADQQAAALSAGYWSIRGKGFGVGARSGGPLTIGEIRDGKVEIAAGWTELRQTLLARIAEIVTGIRSGVFPVFNEEKNCGQYCPLKTGCRIAHVRSLEKTWPPADGKSFSGSLPLVGRVGEGGEAGTRDITPP